MPLHGGSYCLLTPLADPNASRQCIQRLSLWVLAMQISDASLAALACQVNLQQLHLDGCHRITDEGLQHLTGLLQQSSFFVMIAGMGLKICALHASTG